MRTTRARLISWLSHSTLPSPPPSALFTATTGIHGWRENRFKPQGCFRSKCSSPNGSPRTRIDGDEASAPPSARTRPPSRQTKPSDRTILPARHRPRHRRRFGGSAPHGFAPRPPKVEQRRTRRSERLPRTPPPLWEWPCQYLARSPLPIGIERKISASCAVTEIPPSLEATDDFFGTRYDVPRPAAQAGARMPGPGPRRSSHPPPPAIRRAGGMASSVASSDLVKGAEGEQAIPDPGPGGRAPFQHRPAS